MGHSRTGHRDPFLQSTVETGYRIIVNHNIGSLLASICKGFLDKHADRTESGTMLPSMMKSKECLNCGYRSHDVFYSNCAISSITGQFDVKYVEIKCL